MYLVFPVIVDLRGKLEGKKALNTTPKNPTNAGPRRHRLSTEGSTGPWLEGCAPKCNSEYAPFLEGRAPNCPEYPRNRLIRNLWQQDEKGRWYNDDVCTEDEAEVGSAEPSEEEENKK